MPTKDGKGDNYRSYYTTSSGRFCYREHIRFPNHTRVYRKPDSTLETKQKKREVPISINRNNPIFCLSMHPTDRIIFSLLHTHLSRICGDYFRVCILAYQAAQKPLLSLVCQYCNPLPYSINFLACVTVRAVNDSFWTIDDHYLYNVCIMSTLQWDRLSCP